MDDFLTTLTSSITSKFVEEIDKSIINFCKEKGYEVKTPDDLIKVQKKLEKEDKMIRCETFTKIENYTATQIVFTFIDSRSTPLSRKRIYDINKLNEKGYSFY